MAERIVSREHLGMVSENEQKKALLLFLGMTGLVWLVVTINICLFRNTVSVFRVLFDGISFVELVGFSALIFIAFHAILWFSDTARALIIMGTINAYSRSIEKV